MERLDFEDSQAALIEAQRGLELSRERYVSLFNSAPIGYLVLDRNGFIREANLIVLRLLGASHLKLIETLLLHYVATADRRRLLHHLSRCRRSADNEEVTTELRLTGADGQSRDIVLTSVKQSPLTTPPAQARFLTSLFDITARKQAEKALHQALVDRELLMRELQHRVKNSLVIAASMINMERLDQTDERARRAFDSVELRIRSMAAVYEQLYHTGAIDRIDLGQYLLQLVAKLSESYVTKSSPVQIETQLEEVPIELKRALPLGIILNELITNALKYAFPSGQPPPAGNRTIRVDLSRAEGQVHLRVADNGIGIPPEKLQTGGMGLKLVKMLTRQVGGTFSLESHAGCVARMDCPLAPTNQAKSIPDSPGKVPIPAG